MLSEISQTEKANTVWSGLYVESQKTKLTETQSRMVIARGWRWGKWGDVDQNVQTSSYKMNKFWGSNVQHGDYS